MAQVRAAARRRLSRGWLLRRTACARARARPVRPWAERAPPGRAAPAVAADSVLHRRPVHRERRGVHRPYLRGLRWGGAGVLSRQHLFGGRQHLQQRPVRRVRSRRARSAARGETCSSAGNVCSGGNCVLCGGAGQPCCANRTCSATGTACQSDSATGPDTCQPCGGVDDVCCANNTCTAGDAECDQTGTNAGTCQICGAAGEACCSGNRCSDGGCCWTSTSGATCVGAGAACAGLGQRGQRSPARRARASPV